MKAINVHAHKQTILKASIPKLSHPFILRIDIKRKGIFVQSHVKWERKKKRKICAFPALITKATAFKRPTDQIIALAPDKCFNCVNNIRAFYLNGGLTLANWGYLDKQKF